MQHYFIDKEHKETDFFEFHDEILGMNLCFRSCDGIFSKNKIDDGSRILIETIDKKLPLSGFGLDLGCGLGVLAISLIKRFNVTFDMVDINNTAVRLANENLMKNNVQRSANVFYSDGFSNVTANYDFVVSNPPIKTGKDVLFSMMDGAYHHLVSGGQLVLVIRKDKGMESLKKYLVSLFGNCEILARDKGYYILHSIKE